jgi:very-short-patch-repair endonuclease
MGEAGGGLMHKRTTVKIFSHAKQLHRNMTSAESMLWAHLRSHRLNNIHFRNQHAIGNYIVDFCSPKHKLIIELDGSQHLDQAEYDTERTAFLQAKSYRILRFWNDQVMNDINGVIQAITDILEE